MIGMTVQWFFASLIVFARAQSNRSLCNGFAEYCNQKYSSLSYAGAHDSPFVRTEAFSSLFGNQYYNVTTQLNSGIRMLQGQVHAPTNSSSSGPSGIQLCHSACNYPGADFGPLETYLSEVMTWLKANPREVITILWVNGGFDPTVWQSAYQSTGLLNYTYTPPSSTNGVLSLADWPTLTELITNGTRVISFLDTGADFASVPWLLDEFSNVWETRYDITTTTGFDCALDRPYASQNQSSIPQAQKLSLINHFLDYTLGTTGIEIPNATFAGVTNSISCESGSLALQVESCLSTIGRPPNFFLVDFFDQAGAGPVLAAALYNNISAGSLAGALTPGVFPGPFAVPGAMNLTTEGASTGCLSRNVTQAVISSASSTRATATAAIRPSASATSGAAAPMSSSMIQVTQGTGTGLSLSLGTVFLLCYLIH